MKEKNLLLRTLTCVVGVPLVLGMIFLVPHYNFIVFSLFVVAFGFIGSLEMSRLLFSRHVALAFVAPVLPLLQYLQGIIGFNSQIVDLIMVLMLLGGFALEIKLGESEDFRFSLERSAKNALLVLYPNYFISFVLRFLAMPGTSAQTVMMFLLLVFGNDIFAYIFGRLFGKNNKGIFKVSPKKSVAGYVGSLFAAVGVCFACCELFKGSLPYFPIFYRILMGVLMSVSANVGDLLESVFKRSAGVKDSGNIIPGRGGALDCLDSAIASAPVFFIILTLVSEVV